MASPSKGGCTAPGIAGRVWLSGTHHCGAGRACRHSWDKGATLSKCEAEEDLLGEDTEECRSLTHVTISRGRSAEVMIAWYIIWGRDFRYEGRLFWLDGVTLGLGGAGRGDSAAQVSCSSSSRGASTGARCLCDVEYNSETFCRDDNAAPKSWKARRRREAASRSSLFLLAGRELMEGKESDPYRES